MGYEVNVNQRLTFPAYPGVEVEVKTATTFGEFQEIQRIGTAGADTAMDEALGDFADKFIVAWNLESAGEPIPPDREGIAKVPMGIKFAILSGWLELMRGPGAPLGQESSNGLDSPEPSTTEPDSE